MKEPVALTELTSSVRKYYDKLFQDGFLVSVHVSKWGMSTHLEKDDLDYKDKALPDIFKLGKKMLIKPERLNAFIRLEGKARRYLDANSYDFPVSDAHFVPKKAIATVLDTLAKFQQEYLALKDTFVQNYEVYKAEVLEDYPDLAEELAKAYPPVTHIGRKFDFRISMYEIQMPNELGEVDIQSLITRDKAEQEVKKEFESRLRAHYESALTSIETFTENAAVMLRDQVVAICKTVKDKIKKKELVSKKNIEMLREEIENFRTLNFFDDVAVAKELAVLEEAIAGNINYKTDTEALEQLDSALTGVMEKASKIDDLTTISGNYFRAIKL